MALGRNEGLKRELTPTTWGRLPRAPATVADALVRICGLAAPFGLTASRFVQVLWRSRFEARKPWGGQIRQRLPRVRQNQRRRASDLFGTINVTNIYRSTHTSGEPQKEKKVGKAAVPLRVKPKIVPSRPGMPNMNSKRYIHEW